MSTSPYKFLSYADNWSYWATCEVQGPICNKYPTIPAGVQGATAFAVVNNDGTLDARYTLTLQPPGVQGINPAANKVLAVGGWTNSNLDLSGAQNMGMFNVLTNNQDSYSSLDPSTGFTLTGPQRMLINYLWVATRPLGTTYTNDMLPYHNTPVEPTWTPLITTGLGFTDKLIIDYEGFQTNPATLQNPDLVTDWIIALTKKIPDVTIEMAIPGFLTNQTYFQLSRLLTETKINFQLMLYDYAAGLGEADFPVQSNASLAMSWDALVPYFAPLAYNNAYSLNRFYFGFPAYGRGFIVDTGLSDDDIITGITTGTLIASSYAGKNNALFFPPVGRTPISSLTSDFDSGGLISNDAIVRLLGGNPPARTAWDTPSTPWRLVTVPHTTTTLQPVLTFNDYYYYNTTNGLLISAFPNGVNTSSISDLAKILVPAFERRFGMGTKFFGFMNWEAQLDFFGSTMRTLMGYLGVTPVSEEPSIELEGC